jgi:hypothetical protein
MALVTKLTRKVSRLADPLSPTPTHMRYNGPARPKVINYISNAMHSLQLIFTLCLIGCTNWRIPPFGCTVN